MTPEECRKIKALHDAELVPFGERGEMRPRSRGTTYDDGLADPKLATDQTARDQCDINFIMKKYEKTGQLTELIAAGQQSMAGAMYGDFSSASDLQEALHITRHAKEQFALLNAPIRNRFENDPVKFLDFMEDPNTLEEQVTLGLRARNPSYTPPEPPGRGEESPPKGETTPPPSPAPKGKKGE